MLYTDCRHTSTTNVCETSIITNIEFYIPKHLKVVIYFRHCYQSYLDFHRCQKVRGDKYEPCNYFKKVFTSMCPNAWVEKWDTQREEGNFPGQI